MQKALFFWVFFLGLFVNSYADWQRIAPFSAIKWDENTPSVKVDGNWYTLIAINGKTTAEIIAYAKEKYGERWQKRINEDIADVLQGMNALNSADVELELSSNDNIVRIMSKMTKEKRQITMMYLRGKSVISDLFATNKDSQLGSPFKYVTAREIKGYEGIRLQGAGYWKSIKFRETIRDNFDLSFDIKIDKSKEKDEPLSIYFGQYILKLWSDGKLTIEKSEEGKKTVEISRDLDVSRGEYRFRLALQKSSEISVDVNDHQIFEYDLSQKIGENYHLELWKKGRPDMTLSRGILIYDIEH